MFGFFGAFEKLLKAAMCVGIDDTECTASATRVVQVTMLLHSS